MVRSLAIHDYLTALEKESDPQLVDIRTALEYGIGHMNGARSCSLFDWKFRQKISNLDRKRAVFIYCETAHRSPYAAKILNGMGFDAIFDLAGGYRTYRKYLRSKAAK